MSRVPELIVRLLTETEAFGAGSLGEAFITTSVVAPGTNPTSQLAPLNQSLLEFPVHVAVPEMFQFVLLSPSEDVRKRLLKYHKEKLFDLHLYVYLLNSLAPCTSQFHMLVQLLYKYCFHELIHLFGFYYYYLCIF